MSYNCSQASESPDVSAGFIDFLVNGELDEMVSLITYIYLYYMYL